VPSPSSEPSAWAALGQTEGTGLVGNLEEKKRAAPRFERG